MDAIMIKAAMDAATVEVAAGTSAAATDASAAAPWTMDALVEYCLRMQPDEAARREDSALCVTPLVTELSVNGITYLLALQDGRWAALVVRVSSEAQRSALSQQSQDGRSDKADGYSEEEQLVRGIRYFVSQGLAFKIYSDAGVTGEFPNNDPALIARLLDKKARRYESIFRKTLLDETSRDYWTPEQVAQLEAYLAKNVANIRRGQVNDECLLSSHGTAADPLSESEGAADPLSGSEGAAPRRRRGRRGHKVFHRQAFSQLWEDSQHWVHTIAVTDRSRLCRDADLETAMLERMAKHGTRLVGLIEDLRSLDVSGPMSKGVTYLIASLNEQKLTDIAQASFRGTMQRLHSGRPGGRPPWWLWRDEEGQTLVREEMRALVARIVDMSLSGLGARVIQGRLHTEGVRVDGKSLTLMQIHYMITKDVLAGRQTFCGLSWPVYPRLIDDETLADLQRGRKNRADTTAHLRDERSWAQHTFTGIVRCACGARTVCSNPTKARRAAGETGYYRCESSNKDSNTEGVHAWVSERHLEGFFGELLRHHPDLLARTLLAGDGRTLAASMRLQHLEERLGSARALYAHKEADARAQAAASAAHLGLCAGTPGYESVVSGLCESALAGEGKALEALSLELSRAGEEMGQHRQAARALEAARELRGWDDLTAETRNRLLRVLLDRVVVYAMGRMRPGRGRGGYLEIWLAGVDVPLPPVKMKRGKGKSVLLPTPAEWIADMFGAVEMPPEGSPADKTPSDG